MKVLPEATSQYHSDAMENFLPALDSHVNRINAYSLEFIILDARNMNPAQLSTVMNYIDRKYPTLFLD